MDDKRECLEVTPVERPPFFPVTVKGYWRHNKQIQEVNPLVGVEYAVNMFKPKVPDEEGYDGHTQEHRQAIKPFCKSGHPEN